MSEATPPSEDGHAFDLDEGFRVGEFEALPRQGTLKGPQETIRLEPKVMAVLVCLARSGGSVVSRDRFAQVVWRGRIVSDEVLSRDISMLRSHLGDNAKEPRYIQTIPRLGYRLVAAVRPLVDAVEPAVEPDVEPPVATPPPARRSRLWLVGAALLLVVVALVVRYTPAPTSPALDVRTVAVLPFATPPGDGEVFGYGLADEIRISLNGVDGLRVIPGMSSTRFKDTHDTVSSIGTALNAGSLLMGSVRQKDDRIKVTAQLIDANTGLQLWSESYPERALADIFRTQSEISQAIAATLAARLDPIAAAPDTPDIAAFTEFLQARHMLRRRGAAPINRSIELFNAAIERDPQFGRAYVGLAEAFIILPSYSGDNEVPMFELAAAALERAEVLGATEPPAPAIRAYLNTRRWHWDAAARDFAAALAADPNDSDLRQYHSQFLAYVGYIDQALDAARRATELDPLSPVAHQRLGIMYLWVDDVARAEEQFNLALTLGLADQANPEADVALLLRQAQFDKARVRLNEIQHARGKSTAWIDPVIEAISRRGSTAAGVAALVQAHAAQQINDRLNLGALFFIGEPDAFFTAVEDAVATQTPFDVEVLFMDKSSALRSHPRFAALMQRMGLVEFWDTNGWPSACARGEAGLHCG